MTPARRELSRAAWRGNRPQLRSGDPIGRAGTPRGTLGGQESLRLRNIYNPVRPLVGVRSGPDEHEFVNHLSNGGVLVHKKNARAGPPTHQELAEMAGMVRRSCVTRIRFCSAASA